MKVRHEGEIMPPFYYGLAYHNWLSGESYWYIIPINYIVRFGLWVKYKWDGFRNKKSWVDEMIKRAILQNDIEWAQRFREKWMEDGNKS